MNTLVTGNYPGGWKIVKQSIKDVFTNIVPPLLLLLPILVILVLVAAFAFGPHVVATNLPIFIVGALAVLALIYMGLCATVSTYLYGLKRVAGEKMTSKDFYTFRWTYFWKLLVLGLLVGLVLIVGFVLLIIPGVILVIVYLPTMSLVPFVIVEENLGPIEAWKKAHLLRKGHGGKAWALVGWYFLVSIAVGLVIAAIVGVVVLVLVLVVGHAKAADDVAGGAAAGSSLPRSRSNNSSFGSSIFSTVSFAYLYTWIKNQPAPVAVPTEKK